MRKFTGSSRRGSSRRNSSASTAKALADRFRADQRQSLDRVIADRSGGVSQSQLEEAQQPFAQSAAEQDGTSGQAGLVPKGRMRWPAFGADPDSPVLDPEPENPAPDPAPEGPDPEPIPQDPDPEPMPEDPDPEPEDPDPAPTPEDPDPEPIPQDPDPEPTPEGPDPEPEDPGSTPEDPTPEEFDAPRVMGVSVGYLAGRDEGTGGDWFVAPDGEDGNAGTVGAPFATIARAMQAASGGDVIRLRAGVYRESVDFAGKSGSAGARTTVARYGEEQAIVSGFEPLIEWAACTGADEAVVGPNYASIWKKTLAKSFFPAGRVLAANLHEAGVQMAMSSLKVPFPFLPDSNVYVPDWLNATEVVRDGSDHILGYRLAGLAEKYSAAQIENATVRFHGYANSDYERAVDHFDGGTDTIYLQNPDRVYESNANRDRFCLVNFLPALRPGYWGSVEGETDFTLYVWPADPANLAGGIEVTARPIGINFGSASHCEVRGLIIEGNGSAADDGASHQTIRAIGPLEHHSTDLVVDNCLVRRFHRAGPRDGAAVCLRNVDDSVIRQVTLDHARGTHGLFFAGKSPRETGGPCYRNVIDRCLVIAGEFSPLRLYGQSGTRVTRNLAIGCGLGAHANKGNSYWGSSNNLWWGNVFHGCAGYATWQEASGIHWGFNWIPGNITGTDTRSLQDQNTESRLSPATMAKADETAFILNNMMVPFAEGGEKSNSFNVGQDHEPNAKYEVYNNILHGYSVKEASSPILGWGGNVTTKGAAYNQYDSTAAVGDVWKDTTCGDLTVLPGSPTRTAPAHDLTAVLARLAALHPGFDGFGVDLAGNAFAPDAAPVGPYLPDSGQVALPPVWVRPPVIAGSAVVGGTVAVEQVYIVGSPWPRVTFQWIRSDDGFLTFDEIAGATGQDYELQAGDVGCKVGCICTAGGSVAVTVVQDAAVTASYPVGAPVPVAQIWRPRDGTAFTRLETPGLASDGTPLLVVVAARCDPSETGLSATIGSEGRSYGTGAGLDPVGFSKRTTACIAVFGAVAPPIGTLTVQIETESKSLSSAAVHVYRVAGLASATLRNSAGATSPAGFSLSATTQSEGSLVLWAVAANAANMDANPVLFSGAGDSLLNIATGAHGSDIALALSVEPAPAAGAASAAVSWGTAFSGSALWAAVELAPGSGG